MALEPEDRYGSPPALAEDIERWMADEPVTAWREPLSRRSGGGLGGTARRWPRQRWRWWRGGRAGGRGRRAGPGQPAVEAGEAGDRQRHWPQTREAQTETDKALAQSEEVAASRPRR